MAPSEGTQTAGQCDPHLTYTRWEALKAKVEARCDPVITRKDWGLMPVCIDGEWHRLSVYTLSDAHGHEQLHIDCKAASEKEADYNEPYPLEEVDSARVAAALKEIDIAFSLNLPQGPHKPNPRYGWR